MAINLDRFSELAAAKLIAGRKIILSFFALLTLVLLYQAATLKVDAGFEKQLPQEHPYIKTFLDYREQFGGANRLLIVLRAKEGTIFTPTFFTALNKATSAAFALPGVDRSRVSSLFTPNVRFIEVVEDGFAGGDVIPAEIRAKETPTAADFETVRENILKSGQLGRLVSKDFSAALISVQLLERDPRTNAKIDYLHVADALEKDIRAQFSTDKIDVHIIGFAQMMGDIAKGAAGVMLFLLATVMLTAVLAYIYLKCWQLVWLLILAAVTAVIWQLGLIATMGYGIDPMSILLPFLIFAIAVSHGVQMVNSFAQNVGTGMDVKESAQKSLAGLLFPGMVALTTDALGFLVILRIDIPIIQELAVTASVGIAVIVITNLLLLPLCLSWLRLPATYTATSAELIAQRDHWWRKLDFVVRPKSALTIVLVAAVLFAYGSWHGQALIIGDEASGVPELRQDSRYNQDAAIITNKFNVGIDVLQALMVGPPNGCIDAKVIHLLDSFDWTMRNVSGVHSTISLAQAMKTINAGWNEGQLKWRILPEDSQVLVRAVTPIDTSTGLLNSDCSVMPLIMFMADHKATTIHDVVAEIEKFKAANPLPDVDIKLATGNVGIIAATNDSVAAAQWPMLIGIYVSVTLLCWVFFRSLSQTICIMLPLLLVNVLCNALMVSLGIGLKVSTLPIASFGVGIGVDYGIYIMSRMRAADWQKQGLSVAYFQALRESGGAVIFTGLTLAAGVIFWLFSELQFQANMGLLLGFMLLVNMIGAVILMPALLSLSIAISQRWSAVRLR